MFTPGGQLDLHTFAGLRGGGSKGGGSSQDANQSRPIVLTDPVDGTTFVQETNPFLLYQQPGNGVGQSAQDRLNAHIAERKANELAASNQAKADAANKAATDETTFQGRRQSAYDDALKAVTHSFQLAGVDPSQYLESDIKPALQRQFNSIQDLDPNPASAFPTSLGDTILGNVTGGRRTQTLNQFNSLFPTDFANTLLPDSTTNSFVDDILKSQFDPLTSQLTNAQKRGTLNDQGFAAAQKALTDKQTAARATLQNLGQGILSSDRTSINQIGDTARTDISNLGLGTTFDPNAPVGRARDLAATDLANFGGALRSAAGDTQFATLGDLLAAGGAVQGATNPSAINPNGIPGGGPPPEDPLRKQQRGLGNVGAF